jgi:hypothetical protein
MYRSGGDGEQGRGVEPACRCLRCQRRANSLVARAMNSFHCFGNSSEGGNVIDFVVMKEGGAKTTVTMCAQRC